MVQNEATFARRLQDLRAAAGLTQQDLARRSEISSQTLSKLEQGDKEPTWGTVCQLARALDVGVEAFAGDGPYAPPARGEHNAVPTRLVRAARAYALAYDRVERSSRGAGMGSSELFAQFQEAQVELNLAALDSFAAKLEGGAQGKTARTAAGQPKGRARAKAR
jgi:transcriptional regulator with XRE-family HTH domain